MIPSRNFRQEQIATLKIFNDNVLEIKKNEKYSLQFESAGRSFNLSVNLSASFPEDKPKLFLSPIVQHHWINSVTGEIDNAPAFLSFTQHSDLGRIVQFIIREFVKLPPPLLSDPATPKTSTDNEANSRENSPLEALTASPVSLNDSNSSAINISTLSLDELKKLDNDPEFFDDFIEEMSVVQAMNEELDTMINQVEIISHENESKESHLNELKTKLNVDVTALKNLGEKCEKLNLKYMKKSEEFAPQHIKELLQIAASNSDSECDKHVERFLNGKIDVQTFLNSYTACKKISAERKAKEERLVNF